MKIWNTYVCPLEYHIIVTLIIRIPYDHPICVPYALYHCRVALKPNQILLYWARILFCFFGFACQSFSEGPCWIRHWCIAHGRASMLNKIHLFPQKVNRPPPPRKKEGPPFPQNKTPPLKVLATALYVALIPDSPLNT